jgi:hypothetical protein
MAGGKKVMSEIYIIKALSIAEEYIRIQCDFSDFRDASRKSALQFLNKNKIEVGTSDDGGIEFPDLLVHDDVFLFSDFIISKIKREVEDYVFLKPVEIQSEVIGKSELYWMVVPPRIDCLDIDNSDVEYDWDFDLGIIPVLHCKRTVIDESLIGRFKMFKVAGIDDNNIYIVNSLYEIMNSTSPEGIKFIKM